MDDLPSPAAARPTPNTPSVVAHACSQAVVASPPLPVLMDPHLHGIIDNLYPRQIQYEWQHPPQFYSDATTPRIVTQIDLDDNEAAALLSMLRKKIITSVISQIFHIDTPRDWQIEAIHHVLFRRAPLTIISR